MKRNLLILLLLAGIGNLAFGQAVSDRQVIPVSITLNPVLRMTVTKGGNIDFIVNTIDQYTNGLNSGGSLSQYQTEFNVASSTNFNVYMGAEDATFIGTQESTHTLALDNVGYEVTVTGTGTATQTSVSDVEVQELVAYTTRDAIITSAGTGNAGDIGENKYRIDWRLGTIEGTEMNATSLLEQSVVPDRYITNVFLVVEPVTTWY